MMSWITEMEEVMSEQNITAATPLSVLAEQAAASSAWWKPEALENRSEFELPTRILRILDNAGIETVEQLKAAGPHRLRELEGLGKLGFNQIVDLLQALDRQNGGESHA
jgi:DNA-directed RNA polymerase alpha subunit